MTEENLYKGQELKEDIDKLTNRLNKFLKVEEKQIHEIEFRHKKELSADCSFRLVICNFDSDEDIIKAICEFYKKTINEKIAILKKEFEELK